MKPLNYAILKYFTKVEKASVDDVMKALEKDYGHYKSFKKAEMLDALLTAEANGLIQEVGEDLDENGELVIYYQSNDEGRETINFFINE